MNFDYSDIQQMLIESADRLMAARGTVEQWRARRALPDGLDHAAWAQFAELGWLALPVPEHAGGLGGSMEDVALLMIALGRGLAVEPYVSTVVVGAHIVAMGLAEPQRTALLEAVAGGTARLALAHNETEDRYDLDSPRATSARAIADGFTLTGLKTIALDAPSADYFIVSASLEGQPGTALFLVDKTLPGVSIDAYPLIDGSWAADITLTDVSVAQDCLITGGTVLLKEAVDRATVALLGQAVGSMEACLDVCSAYMKERKQFGQAIGSFQALQHIAVDMLVAAHQSRSMLYQAIARIDDEAAARSRAVAMAKTVIGEASQLVSRNGIQIHGGYGMTDEYAIGHHFRRLMVLEKIYGDIEYNQLG